MSNVLLDASVIGGPVPLGVYTIAGALVVTLLVRRYRPRYAAFFAAASGVGAAFGWALSWLVSDVWDLFGISFSMVTRGWIVAFFAGAGVVIAALSLTRRRRVAAILAIPAFLLAAATGINADFAQYPTVRTVLGIPLYGALDATPAASSDATVAMPTAGTVGEVTIPATVSGFAARSAIVYLPPAALVPNPVALPVIEMMSGQPGSPQDAFQAGQLAVTLDAYAKAHNGLAPIVVVPDQLGTPDNNPMCVDSPLGNSATYLTVDVPNWIRSTFHVDSSPTGWVIAGFSQGGTCSIQLGAAHPEIWGTVLDVSGELQPQLATAAQTIASGFGGSKAAYAAAAPSAILAAHTPYSDFEVIVGVGGDDARFGPFSRQIEAAAKKAGATTASIVSPGTSHDWHTVQYVFTQALPLLADRSGLGG
ncbi:MAG: hypothetical protein H7146_01900 [Burkholderiaceae bacterium]|nr:hypothetical protein [Microbacteriaceae bacterium]